MENMSPVAPELKITDLVAQVEPEGVAAPVAPPEKTPKQIEKERKQQEQYWNKMISRKEAYEMMNSLMQYTLQEYALQADEKARILYIQIETLTQFIIDKLGVTREQLDALSKPIISELYQQPDTDAEPAIEREE